tara:strand:+ start:1097 stop:1414 length:318 start_codon:yes stop_codon:yes gene_type:complete
MDDSVDPVEVLQAILNNIVSNSDSKEELIKLWFYIGRMMGIEKIFPEMQVIVTPDDKGVNQPIILIGTLHELVVEYLTSQNVISEDIAHICLREIEKLEEDEVIH